LSLETSNRSQPRRIETRVLLKKQQGEWAGYSYRWNEDQTDAELVGKAGEEIEIPMRNVSEGTSHEKWRIPSRAECLACHSGAANFVLGPSEPQMKRDQNHGSKDNQIAALDRLGLLSEWPPKPPEPTDEPLPPLRNLVNPYDESQNL